MIKKYKLIQELYKDNEWRIELGFSFSHNKYCIFVCKRTNKKYAHRRAIFINSIIDDYYIYFITAELNSNIKVNIRSAAKKSQERATLDGVREELDCKIITTEFLEALKASHLIECIGGKDMPCLKIN